MVGRASLRTLWCDYDRQAGQMLLERHGPEPELVRMIE